jgi:hypothetical protein
MRELLGHQVLHRVKGRPVLERRLYGLLRAVHRFSRARATTRRDADWAARMVDTLTVAVQVAQADWCPAQAPPAADALGSNER